MDYGFLYWSQIPKPTITATTIKQFQHFRYHHHHILANGNTKNPDIILWLSKEEDTKHPRIMPTFYQKELSIGGKWADWVIPILLKDHLRQQISSCDCPYRLFKELSMGEKEPTEAFLSCRRRSNAVTVQAPPSHTYTHIVSWLGHSMLA